MHQVDVLIDLLRCPLASQSWPYGPHLCPSGDKDRRRLLLRHAPVTAAVACDVRRVRQSFNKTVHLHIGHVRLYDFLSSQQLLSFLQICGCRIAPTLIQSITTYKVWTDIQQWVYQLQLHSIDELKKCLLDIWHGINQSVIDDAVDKWR